MNPKTIVILGAGVGGQAVANALAPRIGGTHRIVLIDQLSDFSYSPSFLWTMIGERRPEQVRRPLANLIPSSVDRRTGRVVKIDSASKTVSTNSESFGFDYLVIALGAELAPDITPGFPEAALNLYTLDGSIAIHHRLQKMEQGRIVVLISAMPYKCPAAPYEAVLLIDHYVKSRRRAVAVDVYTPEPFPMPTAGPGVGEALKGMLESRGIRVNVLHKASKIDAVQRSIHFENGQTAGYDLLIGVPVHRAPSVVRDAGLTNESGWIPVDRSTLQTAHSDIYAIGDVTTIPLAGGKSLPKAGVFAHAQANVVADHIVQRIEGRISSAAFDGVGACAIEMGGGVAAFGSGDFYAAEGPVVTLFPPSQRWHWGKVLFEKWWLSPPGSIQRKIYRKLLEWGAAARGISLKL